MNFTDRQKDVLKIIATPETNAVVCIDEILERVIPTISKPALQQVMKRMRKDGYITREIRKFDRNGIVRNRCYLELTEKGKEAVCRL